MEKNLFMVGGAAYRIFLLLESRRLIMKTINLVSYLLVVIGAINWTLSGVFGVDIVTTIFGTVDVLPKLVYFLIGLSGVHMVLSHRKTFIH